MVRFSMKKLLMSNFDYTINNKLQDSFIYNRFHKYGINLFLLIKIYNFIKN